jgi:hypothetical protein
LLDRGQWIGYAGNTDPNLKVSGLIGSGSVVGFILSEVRYGMENTI